MLGVRLRAGVGHCDIDGRTIFLDVRRDRYLMISPDLEQHFQKISAGVQLGYNDLHALLRTGLFDCSTQNTCSVSSPTLAYPQRAITVSSIHIKMRSKFGIQWIWAATCLLIFHATIKHLSLKRSLALAELLSWVPFVRLTQSSNAIAIATFQRASILFPKGDRCLPEALALFSYLGRLRPPAKIVFGVSINPFQAHCWLQEEDLVLGQDIEDVLPFRPILAMP